MILHSDNVNTEVKAFIKTRKTLGHEGSEGLNLNDLKTKGESFGNQRSVGADQTAQSDQGAVSLRV